MISGTAQVVRVGCQLASVILLSRLLAPSDFGIIAMSWPVVGLLMVFQDFGLTEVTIQKKRLTDRDANFLFWVNTGIGLLVTLAILALAPVAGWFYGEPRVVPVIAAMSGLVVLQALGAQHTALLRRMMRFRALAIMDVAAAIGNLSVASLLAATTGSYWALFGGSLAGTLTMTALAWGMFGWLPGRPAGTEDGRELIGFGAGLTGFTLSNFFVRNADNILIGRYLGEVALGYYDRAYKLILLPLQLVTTPIARSIVPTLSRLVDQPNRYRSAYLNVGSLVLAVTLPGIGAVVAMSDSIVPFLLGEQWQESAQIFQLLGFAGLLQPLNSPSGWLFVSQARSTEFMYWGLISALIVVAAIFLGVQYGVYGVALGYAISEYVRTPLLWTLVSRRGPVKFRDVCAMAGPYLLGVHVAIAILFLIDLGSLVHPVVATALALLVSYGIVGAIVLAFPVGRDTVQSVRRMRWGAGLEQQG